MTAAAVRACAACRQYWPVAMYFQHRATRRALVEDHLEDEGRDREERERRQDIQNRDQDSPATLPAHHAAPELVELVGLGHVPSLPRFYFGLPSAFRPSSVILYRSTLIVAAPAFIVSVTTVASPASTSPASMSRLIPWAIMRSSSAAPP